MARKLRLGEDNNLYAHGLSREDNGKKSSEYTAWINMKMRCYNKNDESYSRYGGRCIKVCNRWKEPNGRGYLNFKEDMGNKPHPTYSIDRIDVNGNYEPSNCRWASKSVQSQNQRPRILNQVIVGYKTHDLTVIKEATPEFYIDKRGGSHMVRKVEVLCACGNTNITIWKDVKAGRRKSCGCRKFDGLLKPKNE